MKNKLIFLFIVFLLFTFVIAQQKKMSVTIKGTLKNFTNQEQVEDLSEFQYLLRPGADRMIIPDANGNFNITFSLSAPNYFRIGRNILYLTPGDDLEVFIDKNAPSRSSFSGKGNEANNYLRLTPFPKGGSYIEAGSNAKPTAKATVETIIHISDTYSKRLDSVQNVSTEFKRLENARIKADIINSLQAGQISFYRPQKISADSLKIYAGEYKQLIEPLIATYSKGFVDASLMKLVVYRDIAERLLKQEGKISDIREIKDWIAATALMDEMKKISDKMELALFKSRTDAIATAKYKNALNNTLQTMLAFGKGDQAMDFTATDIGGNAVTLASLKGKVIYIDMWATWCGPCMAEMPHYEELKAKYANDQGIVFISLSIDDDLNSWRSNVAKRNAKGYQWQINRNKLTAYNIVEIPRVLLIGKDFTMADMNAPIPSAKNLPAIIESLLK